MDDKKREQAPKRTPGRHLGSHEPERSRQPLSRKKKILLGIVGVLLVLILAGGLLGLHYLRLYRSGQWQPSEATKDRLKQAAASTELMRQAEALKDDLSALADQIKAQDTDAAAEAHAQMQQDLQALRKKLNSPAWKAAASLPGIGGEIRTAGELTELLEDADSAIIGPYLEQMEQYPLTDLKVGEGINMVLVSHYLDFVEQVLPEAQVLGSRLQGLDLGLLDQSGSLTEKLGKLESLLAAADQAQEILPALRAILCSGDKVYLFAAQNTSELRASGGFPGSIGMVRIRDGVMTISDFQGVTNVFWSRTPREAEITATENSLFFNRMNLSWDADFSPDFERVASIWAMAYEERNGEAVDGVISGTPAIIQKLLAIVGSVTLSDGTELNGENACRVLGHDLYFKYLGKDQQSWAADYVDGLFAESAKLVMEKLMSSLQISMGPDYLRFLLDSTADRTLMFWLADEQGQELIRQVGWACTLNRDPMHPQAGIFYNSVSASKMTWFLDIDPELSEPTLNEDGSLSYELTVTCSNVITQEELNQAGFYIKGRTAAITGSIYVFAPAGGRVDNYEFSGKTPVHTENYRGLDLCYVPNVDIHSYAPLVLRCRITTAPGAEPLGLMLVPTMQNYR